MHITITEQEYQELVRVKREYDSIKNTFDIYTMVLSKAIADVRREPETINYFLNALESLVKDKA